MKRQPANLSESLCHRLNSYALAASAAGVGVLALTQPAEAKIVYTEGRHVIPTNSVYALNLSHGSAMEFLIQHQGAVFGSTSWWDILSVRKARSNAVAGYRGFASALDKGKLVGPEQAFISFTGTFGALMEEVACQFSCDSIGAWKGANNRYLGLRFYISGRLHYGWARLSVSELHPKVSLTGFAYETIPNKPIITGKTHGRDVVTVEPGSLGALAAGRK